MDSFKKLRDMYRLQKEAKKVKKELKNIQVVAEGRWCKVVVSAEQEIVSIEIQDGAPLAELSADLTDALNRALKKAQLISADRMKGVMDEMGISPGQA
jgi:DNA-binding protein YbaB